MGNSEVGHLNIGAGRVVYQDFTRIDHAIATGEFARNPVLVDAVAAAARERQARCTCWASCRRAACTATSGRSRRWSSSPRARRRAAHPRARVPRRPRHAAAQRGARRSRSWTRVCARHPRRAHRVDRAAATTRWTATSAGSASPPPTTCSSTAARRSRPPPRAPALDAAYARGETDEFVQADRDRRRGRHAPRRWRDGDVVVFMNFRADRARQLTRALTDPAFDGFAARARAAARARTSASRATATSSRDLPVAFAPQSVAQRLRRVPGAARPHAAAHRRDREVRARHLLLQRRRRGGLPGRGPHPRAVAARSPPTTCKPEMSAPEVTDKLVAAIALAASTTRSSATTPTATWSATPATSTRRSRRSRRSTPASAASSTAARAAGGEVLITADHGNAEKMHDDGDRAAAHGAHAQPRAVRLRRPAGARSRPAARCRTSRRRCSR